MVTLAVRDYETLKYRDRDVADMAYHASDVGSDSLTSATIVILRAPLPFASSRAPSVGVASPCRFFQAITIMEIPDVDIIQKHRTKGRYSASTFLVGCVDDDKDDYIPVVTIMWQDDSRAISISDVDIDEAAPPKLAEALRKFSP